MSRSRRKSPVVTLQQHDTPGIAKKAKRLANRAVRASNDVPDGSAYRKYSDSWDICDYKCYCPEGGEKVRRK